MTMDQIKAATPGTTLWDKGERASVKGLHLRVLNDGTKVFMLYYRTKSGTQRRPKLGQLGELTLNEARKRAAGLMARVAVGEDPKAEWDEKKAEKTVSELFEACWKSHWDTPRYQTSGWAYEAKRLFEKNIAPSFGHLKMSEVTAAKVRDWHKRYEEKPLAGNRALNVFSKIFNFAEEQEWRPQHTNPCELVNAFPEKKRTRYANEQEIAKLIERLEHYFPHYPAAAAFLLLLAYTGSRPRFIERARWEHLQEFEHEGQIYGILTLAGKTSAKTGEDEKVIIPPQAMRFINFLPRVKGGTITGIGMPRKLWVKIREEVGCHDLWARDWRRTWATVGQSDGVNLSMIGELLNHRDTQTTKRYAKLLPTKQVETVSQIANRIQAAPLRLVK